MRLVTFAHGAEARVGVWREREIVDLRAGWGKGDAPASLLAMLAGGPAAMEHARAVADNAPAAARRSPDAVHLLAPLPRPPKLLCVGLNYRDHAEETGVTVLPREPVVFTKFPACHTGPEATVALPSSRVDFEVELVVVIGRRAEHAAEADGWDYVAGLTVGNDLSERTVQLAGPVREHPIDRNDGEAFDAQCANHAGPGPDAVSCLRSCARRFRPAGCSGWAS